MGSQVAVVLVQYGVRLQDTPTERPRSLGDNQRECDSLNDPVCVFAELLRGLHHVNVIL